MTEKNATCNKHDLPSQKASKFTNANSGSSFGSTPNSKPVACNPAPEPSSPTMIGELISASDSNGPGGTVTKWDLLF